MYMSDRAMAVVYFLLGIFMAPAILFVTFMLFPFPANPYGIVSGFPMEKFEIAMVVISAALMWMMSAWFFFRNRPVFGRDEYDTRRRIKLWYRDAKKWMDEHPEDVEMKDL